MKEKQRNLIFFFFLKPSAVAESYSEAQSPAQVPGLLKWESVITEGLLHWRYGPISPSVFYYAIGREAF